MIVTRTGFDEILKRLAPEPRLAVDTETTGLRMYHGDRLFSIILSTETDAYYFNFIPYPKLEAENILGNIHLKLLRDVLFEDPKKLWYIQNAANFDLCIFGVEDIDLKGEIHCTKAIGRVEYNEHFDGYSLDTQLKRLGRAKDDKVMAYIKENKLWTDIPGNGGEKYRVLHFDKVPWEIITPYGEVDARETFFLGDYQTKSILKQDLQAPELSNGRSLQSVMENERRLQKTIYRMKHRGVLIDRDYCKRASQYEKDQSEKAELEFGRITGSKYSASPKLFAEVFKDEKERWSYTEKGNPSFDSTALSKLEHPGARLILDIRGTKSRSDFYDGFLWFADNKGVVHPNYNPEGTTHGRFSSSEPNFQNLTSEETDEEIAQEFIVRRAIIPRPGYVLFMPDYKQMEYKFMLDQACKLLGRITPLGQMVLDGFDFHEATAQNAASVGSKVVRKQCKIANFLTLYGGGPPKLAAALNIPLDEAKKIRAAIFGSAPEIKTYIDTMIRTAEVRGYIINWLGRRCQFPNKNFAYRAPNYHISGGCADVVKVAMNRIDDLLISYKSKMIMTVHDELPTEIHESEFSVVPKLIQDAMESVYKSAYIPLDTDAEWSPKSLGDKIKGLPV